ncbi:Phosphomutase-like protein 3 [Apiospora hydei]|uniref:Phosphomutase-like protein 3 n=1 Tax=Apiospora hydei TaxID=1337664 RepID=A0ABR1WXM3_9PEZI
MSDHYHPLGDWAFTRADCVTLQRPYFQRNLRLIAGNEPDYTLPWDDNMYLIYPSEATPDWKKLYQHVKELNAISNQDSQYKIVYVMRRAHKKQVPSNPNEIDPEVSELGKKQCSTLQTGFERAITQLGLPPPDVVVTSPLTRALQTTQWGLAPIFDSSETLVLEGLREKVTGDGKNKRHSKSWIKEQFPQFDCRNVDDTDRFGATYCDPTNEEPYHEVWRRVYESLAFLFENRKRDPVVLLMTHCLVIQTIQREIDGWDVPEEERKSKEFYVGEAGGYAMIIKGERSRVSSI